MTERPVWIDIENPPQVQYLAPFVDAFRGRGHPVMVTARDNGITVGLLRERRIPHSVVGTDPPAGRTRKLVAVGRRAVDLQRIASKRRPAAVVCSSRAAALVARARGIPCFVMCDYEFAELRLYRRFGAVIVHPAVVPASAFTRLGFRTDHLIAFDGLKEDISFAGIDVDNLPAHDFGPMPPGVIRVLVRPPAESSHYFDPRSRASTLALLDRLAARDDVLTVFSPRHPRQAEDLEARSWRRDPIVLDKAIPFVPLLKAVDRVVSAGGTMLREAAYIGVPAYSLFASHLGAVDEHLRTVGRLIVLSSPDQFDSIFAPIGFQAPFPRNGGVLDTLSDAVLARAVCSTRSKR